VHSVSGIQSSVCVGRFLLLYRLFSFIFFFSFFSLSSGSARTWCKTLKLRTHFFSRALLIVGNMFNALSFFFSHCIKILPLIVSSLIRYWSLRKSAKSLVGCRRNVYATPFCWERRYFFPAKIWYLLPTHSACNCKTNSRNQKWNCHILHRHEKILWGKRTCIIPPWMWRTWETFHIKIHRAEAGNPARNTQYFTKQIRIIMERSKIIVREQLCRYWNFRKQAQLRSRFSPF